MGDGQYVVNKVRGRPGILADAVPVEIGELEVIFCVENVELIWEGAELCWSVSAGSGLWNEVGELLGWYWEALETSGVVGTPLFEDRILVLLFVFVRRFLPGHVTESENVELTKMLVPEESRGGELTSAFELIFVDIGIFVPVWKLKIDNDAAEDSFLLGAVAEDVYVIAKEDGDEFVKEGDDVVPEEDTDFLEGNVMERDAVEWNLVEYDAVKGNFVEEYVDMLYGGE